MSRNMKNELEMEGLWQSRFKSSDIRSYLSPYDVVGLNMAFLLLIEVNHRQLAESWVTTRVNEVVCRTSFCTPQAR
jgi:hypothetical protein